jgi:hypothetical protein
VYGLRDFDSRLSENFSRSDGFEYLRDLSCKSLSGLLVCDLRGLDSRLSEKFSRSDDFEYLRGLSCKSFSGLSVCDLRGLDSRLSEKFSRSDDFEYLRGLSCKSFSGLSVCDLRGLDSRLSEKFSRSDDFEYLRGLSCKSLSCLPEDDSRRGRGSLLSPLSSDLLFISHTPETVAFFAVFPLDNVFSFPIFSNVLRYNFVQIQSANIVNFIYSMMGMSGLWCISNCREKVVLLRRK